MQQTSASPSGFSALAGLGIDVLQERAAAGAVGVAGAVELQLGRAQFLGVVRAGDRLLGRIRIANDLGHCGVRRRQAQLVGADLVFDPLA